MGIPSGRDTGSQDPCDSGGGGAELGDGCRREEAEMEGGVCDRRWGSASRWRSDGKLLGVLPPAIGDRSGPLLGSYTLASSPLKLSCGGILYCDGDDSPLRSSSNCGSEPRWLSVLGTEVMPMELRRVAFEGTRGPGTVLPRWEGLLAEGGLPCLPLPRPPPGRPRLLAALLPELQVYCLGSVPWGVLSSEYSSSSSSSSGANSAWSWSSLRSS
mmetsp:Transcript_17105/g.47738  ORF Transcript_17105/g.47738 Transcript_17105/m.47738 type:complete len:214 (-) Transcript_17105:665-1306(-)